MPLAPGVRLGAYEVVGLLGSGGMGEVYRAHDTKLNRQVALKVLPDAYASDPERITRFHREAQAIAALNHANIAAIYDLAEASTASGDPAALVRFLVLELVEGDTLATRMSRGALPVEEALQIARQILEALETAHEKSICHRDLKPANVKVTPEGIVKVLDFGLAKFLTSAPAAANLTHSPTLTLGATVPGVILGTAAYMSPEQAKGLEADQRSDIFSFGCMLFEMLTGRQAFEGETVSEILASVLKTEADFTQLPPRLNRRLVDVLRRCLEKNPKKRWHSAADVRVEIETVIGRGVVVEAPRPVEVRQGPLWKRAAVPVAAALVAALAAGYGAWNLKPEPARSTARFSVALPEGQIFTNTGRNVIALSPDGTNLVYVANQRLYLRSMASLEARVIAGTEGSTGVVNPVFSPDGQELAFFSLSELALKRISIRGGSAVTICPAENPFGMNWGEHGIVFGQAKGVMRVPATGGTPEIIAPAGNGEMVSTPQILPDGRTVLFSVKETAEGWDSGRIVVQPLGGGERKVLVEGGSVGYYLSSGHLVYAVSGTLRAVAFDLSTLTVQGGQVPIVEGVRRSTLMSGSATTGAVHASYSQTGALAYAPGPVKLSGDGTDLALFDRKGGEQPLGLSPGAYSSPRASPDGRFVAFERTGDRDVSIWMYELSANRAAQQLTFGGNNRAPVWSPDGRSIAFQSDREGDRAIYLQRADGSGTAERLSKPDAGLAHIPQSWSRDGASLLFSIQKGNEYTLWTMTLRDRKAAAFGGVAAREAAFSPDGRWVAYQAREETNVVYVEPFPRTGAKYIVSRPGGHPFWSSKGDEIIMNVGPTRSSVVGVTTTPRVAFAKPAEFTRIGRSEQNPLTARRNADMMPDGRVIGVRSDAGLDVDSERRQITVVLNWFEELRQRVPIR